MDLRLTLSYFGWMHRLGRIVVSGYPCFMDLPFLKSDPPETNIKINRLLAIINIFPSYRLVIFIVGQSLEGERDRISSSANE